MNTLQKRALNMGFSPFRIYLADFLYKQFCKKSGDKDQFWFLLHLAEQAGRGHIRTQIEKIGDEFFTEKTEDKILPSRLQMRVQELLNLGLEQKLIDQLKTKEATTESLPTPRPPLVLSADGQSIYFLRRRREEDDFLAMLHERTGGAYEHFEDSQKTPTERMVKRLQAGYKLIILSGGPGTGKTTTIVQLLEFLDKEHKESGKPPLQVLLSAPTGRAASRMTENMENRTGRTLHGLLGIVPGSPPRYNSRKLLEADIVIVDEASMVDLSLMNALLQSLSPETALILIGDPDQLPSVEAGALLGDLLKGAREAEKNQKESPLTGSVVQLTKVYRSDTAILRAASAVRDGNLQDFFNSEDGNRVTLHPMKQRNEIAKILATVYRENVGVLDSFTALTPLRQGSWGVPAMNEEISRLLSGSATPFHNMPIVITRNDAAKNLWNGDRGLLQNREGNLRAVFQSLEGERCFPLGVLSAWEPAWMQTIHRSQGSEFNFVTVILPKEANRLLSREILYTALTRARDRVDIYADEDVLEKALEKQVVRYSRIRETMAGR